MTVKEHLISMVIALMFFPVAANGQGEGLDPEGPDTLSEILAEKDSLLFHAAFVTCDTAILNDLVSDDFEFYHDQSGVMHSKREFIQNAPNLCALPYTPSRRLRKETLEVFPLYDDGVLYGAIQKGTHDFYAKEHGIPEYLTSTALFTHVWILEGEDWRLRRVLSYDHH